MMMISDHRMGDNDNGPDRVIVCILPHKHHKRHRYQRHERRRYQRHKRHQFHQYSQWLSRSRLLVLMKTLVALEDDKDPDHGNEHLYMYLLKTDDESAATEPQGRMSHCSSSPQGRESPRRQKGKNNSAEVKKPRDLPRGRRQKLRRRR